MTAHLDGEIRDGRHHMQVRVYYEDTDFSGIVYHANYLRYMERGRTNHLRLMGAEQQALFDQPETEGAGFAFVVRSMHLDFLKPARMDDVLDVVTWPVAVKGLPSCWRRRCGAVRTCWSRLRCASLSSAAAGRNRSRNRSAL